MSKSFSLVQLGWRPFYSQQLTLSDLAESYPARVMAVHRTHLDIVSERGQHTAVLGHTLSQGDVAATVTVGDWLLIENEAPRVARVLGRQSEIARRAAGKDEHLQLIAANLDTLFIVSACDADFNLSRIERYLALAMEVRIESVLVLTKSDLCVDIDARLHDLREAAPTSTPVALDARSPAAVAQLTPWLAVGQTVACVGSSGVGKSTLINTLCGAESQATGAIREDDAKGRHTTTARQLLPMPAGAWLIDTPGMRELKLGAVSSGVQAVFADIEQLAGQCRFRDCRHEGDAGCAVTSAVNAGALDVRRLNNYFKLRREAERATQGLHERHARMRQFGRIAKSAMQEKRRRREGGD